MKRAASPLTSVAAVKGIGMEAKLSAMLEGRGRRELTQEVLALYAWSLPEPCDPCELSKVLGAAPAHARVGLALWLEEAAIRAASRPDSEMNPERFPRRRSTRLMIPHTAGNSDRVLFTVRMPEPGAATPDNASAAEEGGAYQVAVHGDRRARRASSSSVPSSPEEAATDFTGVPAPAWIVAHQAGSERK